MLRYSQSGFASHVALRSASSSLLETLAGSPRSPSHSDVHGLACSQTPRIWRQPSPAHKSANVQLATAEQPPPTNAQSASMPHAVSLPLAASQSSAAAATQTVSEKTQRPSASHKLLSDCLFTSPHAPRLLQLGSFLNCAARERQG